MADLTHNGLLEPRPGAHTVAIANPNPSPLIPQEWDGTVPEKADQRTRYECCCGAWCEIPRGHIPAFLEMHEDHEQSWVDDDAEPV